MGTTAYQKYPKNFAFDNLKVLNLGCGFTKFKSKNVVNVDKFDCCNPDVVWDLDKVPLPFEDESFDYIFSNHVFEHLHNWWECFGECARVLKTGGTMDVYIPHTGSDGMMGYRDHVSVINPCSFFGVAGLDYMYCNAWGFENSGSHAGRLRLVHIDRRMEDHKWMRFMPKKLKLWCAEHLRNVVNEEHYKFIKISEKEYNDHRERLRNHYKTV